MIRPRPEAARSTRRGNASRVGIPLAVVVSCSLGLPLLGCGDEVEARMGRVRAHQDAGRFAASVPELRVILAAAPDLPEANFRLGQALVQTGEPTRAIWPLSRAAADHDYAVPAGLLLSSTHLQTRNYDEAVAAASRVLELDPDRHAARQIRAQANLAARRLEAALDDTTALAALDPDDYGVRVLHASVLADSGRLDEARLEHDRLKELGARGTDPALRARSCIAPALFAMDFLKDRVRARELYEQCASAALRDATVLMHTMSFFEEVGDPQRATALAREAVATSPDDPRLRRILATRLVATGDVRGAESVLLAGVERSDDALAWSGLASFYRSVDEHHKALAAIEQVLERSGGGNDPILFTQADLLIDVGELVRAEQVAGRIARGAYAELIRGRIRLVRGDPAAALSHFERGLRAWPNNAAARYLAGMAARDLGDYRRAISELREALRAGESETHAGLELARIHHRMRAHVEALRYANLALRGPGGAAQSEPYVIAARSLSAQGRYDRALRSIEALQAQGHEALALRERALLARRRGRPGEALALLEASGIEVSDAAHLAQLCETLVELDRPQEALSRLDAAARTPSRRSRPARDPGRDRAARGPVGRGSDRLRRGPRRGFGPGPLPRGPGPAAAGAGRRRRRDAAVRPRGARRSPRSESRLRGGAAGPGGPGPQRSGATPAPHRRHPPPLRPRPQRPGLVARRGGKRAGSRPVPRPRRAPPATHSRGARHAGMGPLPTGRIRRRRERLRGGTRRPTELGLDPLPAGARRGPGRGRDAGT